MTSDEYRAKRDILIPGAVRHANRLHGAEPAKSLRHDEDAVKAWRRNWTRAYHDAMGHAAHAAGLQAYPPVERDE